jgi:DNA-binding winged helix-turn-helix (wHTH) protein/TolB-like protein
VTTQQSRSQHVAFGPYRFDRDAGDLYRRDDVVPLQPQLLQLLRCLLERPGEVVSRTELCARLWPPHTVVDFEVGLNAAVKKLRTALTDSPASPEYIETVPRRGYRFIGVRKPSGTCQAIDALAVLPFSLEGGHSRMKHLGEAVAERLIHALSAVPGIGKVIARELAFKYARSEPAEIGRALAVRAVLTGHLTITRRSARLTVELIDTAGESHLWGTMLERPLSELSQLQVELADEVCAALSASLPEQESQQDLAARTQRFDIYRLYLQGRYAFGKRTLSATNEAIDLFERAIQNDSRFALAHSGLADCYNSLASWEVGSIAPSVGFEKGRQLALRALQLDHRSAEAHTSLAFTHLHYSWEWDLAEQEFRRALAINPRYPHARHWYSHLLGALGRTAESLQESQTLVELDPFDLVTNVHMCWHHYMAREFAPALREAQRTLEMEKRWAWGYFFTALALCGLGEYHDAVRRFHKSFELSGRQNFVAFNALGYAYGRAGMRDRARDILRHSQELAGARYVSSYELALIHLGLGEEDMALERLNKAVEERSGWLPYLANDVRLDPLRSSPQFKSVAARVGLPSHSNVADAAHRVARPR